MPEPAEDFPPLSGVDPQLYSAVAQRRLQWDSLVWQVPVLSLTAQAFLLTIGLSADTRQLPRAVAFLLALVAALLAMHLMSRQRQAEITDAHWLEAYEKANFQISFTGRSWQEARASQAVLGPVDRADLPKRLPSYLLQPIANRLGAYGGFVVWMYGFALFAVSSAVLFVITFAAPTAL